MSFLEWAQPGADVVVAIIALAAFVRAYWRDDKTDDREQRIRELQPILDKLAHLDECLDAHEKSASTFRGEVRTEFQSMRSQVMGGQVEALSTFATKEEVRNNVVDLRSEINLAGRMTALERR